MSDRDELARAYDPQAFEDHPVEKRSQLAAIQWGARRHLAGVAADQVLASGWLAEHDAALTTEVLRAAAKDALTDYAEGRARRRLWHVWLAERASATSPTPSTDEGNETDG